MYDITDKYGAIVLLKGMIASIEKDTNITKQDYMNNTFKIVRDCLMEDINEIQAEIFNEFTGNIKGLMEQIKESEDD